MSSNDLPIAGAAATPAAPTTAPSTSSSTAESTPDTKENEFVTMLAELMSTAGATPTALPVVLQKDTADEKADTSASDATALLIDPQAMLFAVENSQLTTKGIDVASLTQELQKGATSTIGSNTDGTPPLAARSLLSPTMLIVANDSTQGASQGDTSSLATSLASSSGVELPDLAAKGAPNDIKSTADALSAANAIPQPLSTAERSQEVPERLVVRAHVGTPAWPDELAGKLTFMAERGVHSASLQLSPEQLGPLEIRITVQNDQTSVWFGAAHAETRVALEAALPRLRELFASQGLNLSDAGVFREAPRDQAKQYAASRNSQDATQLDIAITTNATRGIVDAYA